MPPKRKFVVSGPKRASQRLKAQFRGVRSVPITPDPIELEFSESPTHTAVNLSTENEVQPPNEQEHSTGGTNVEEPIPENVEPTAEPETPAVGVSETPYSNPRFENQQSEDRYTKWYSKRAVLVERGIHLDDYTDPPFELKRMIENRGWSEWVAVGQKVIVPLVKEFYANAVRGEDGVKEIHTKVRKTPIIVTPELIAKVAALPIGNIPVATPQQQASWEEQSSKANLAKLLSENQHARWDKARLSKGDLTEKNRVLHMLVCAKILPHAYVSSVTVSQAEFVGKLLLDIPIDLAEHIWQTIDKAVGKPEENCAKSSSGLPFGGLITKILQSHGVKGKVGMEMIKPAARIAKTSMKRSQGQLSRKVAAEPQQEQQPEGQTRTEEVTLQTLYELVKEVKDKQVELAAELKSLKDQQEANHQQVMESLEGLHAPAAPEEYMTPPDH